MRPLYLPAGKHLITQQKIDGLVLCVAPAALDSGGIRDVCYCAIFAKLYGLYQAELTQLKKK